MSISEFGFDNPRQPAAGHPQQKDANVHGNLPYSGLNPNPHANKNMFVTSNGSSFGAHDDPTSTEGVFMKQANGSKVILRPDGTVEIKANGGALNIEAGDDVVIKSSGNGRLQFNGDLDFHTTGNLSIRSDGNLSMTSGNNIMESARNGAKSAIYKEASEQVVENKTTQVGRTHSNIAYEGYSVVAKGPMNVIANGDMKFNAGRMAQFTGTEMVNISSKRMNVVSKRGNFVTQIGTIGGYNAIFHGRNVRVHETLSAKTVGIRNTIYTHTIKNATHIQSPTFVGNLVGISLFAIISLVARPAKTTVPRFRWKLGPMKPTDRKAISTFIKGATDQVTSKKNHANAFSGGFRNASHAYDKSAPAASTKGGVA
jgi:hypothetical protein